MKTQKLFSLDYDLVLELQKLPNASKVVNDLIKEYLSLGDMKNMSLSELKRLEAKEKRKAQLQKELKELDG